MCGTLVYADKLKELAATAERATAAGDLGAARAAWEDALRWLPQGSQQYAAIQQHVADLTKQGAVPPPAAAPQDTRPWWKRGAAGLVAIVVLALSKLKFLLLGLTKIGTLVSMFGFFAVYWAIYGWPLAIGLLLSIYIHEMGHVAEIRKEGIDAGAPLFVPGLGAFIMLRTHITDPKVDARIGLAGPVWGLGAALAAYAVYLYTGSGVGRDRAARRLDQSLQSHPDLAARRVARIPRARDVAAVGRRGGARDRVVLHESANGGDHRRGGHLQGVPEADRD